MTPYEIVLQDLLIEGNSSHELQDEPYSDEMEDKTKIHSENDSLQAENNSLQEEVAILTKFGVLQSVQIHQQVEEAQSNNELWAIAQKECWEAQKKVIQQDKEIVSLKGEVK
ncbi:hypothetical protein RirG_141320 [Rhizophagus irregularis DAOM 197198w]|uniref:Uncharacterized protein n=1 Tax=Rhizophagus irregularis (strain DAOM 197198w) TaxID=1432141 RepID=A0A015JCD4_RHIIW|nr:hypothetical protein RirG_141320 [Rhizophagus irregularis DAOM 197198w]